MKLTRAERLILSLQYKILEHLDKGDAKYYQTVSKAVENGYELEYDQLAQHVLEESLPVNQCRFVLEVMEMYDSLQRGQKTSAAVKTLEVEFPGFDGNKETALRSYARYIIGENDQYDSLDKVPDLNSHTPMVEIYERMLNTWNATDDKDDLTEADIRRILDAKTHSSHRIK